MRRCPQGSSGAPEGKREFGGKKEACTPQTSDALKPVNQVFPLVVDGVLGPSHRDLGWKWGAKEVCEGLGGCQLFDDTVPSV